MELVEFIHNPEGKGAQDRFFQIRIHYRRMACRDKAHLAGKGKIKIQDPSAPAVAYRIIYVSLRTYRSPGVIAVNLKKIFINFLPLIRLGAGMFFYYKR